MHVIHSLDFIIIKCCNKPVIGTSLYIYIHSKAIILRKRPIDCIFVVEIIIRLNVRL